MHRHLSYGHRHLNIFNLCCNSNSSNNINYNNNGYAHKSNSWLLSTSHAEEGRGAWLQPGTGSPGKTTSNVRSAPSEALHLLLPLLLQLGNFVTTCGKRRKHLVKGSACWAVAVWQVRVCASTGRGHFQACPKLVRGLPLRLRCLVMLCYKFVNRNSSSVIILLPFTVPLLLPPSGLKFSCHFNSTVVLVLLHVKAALQHCYHISLLLLILLQLSLLLLPLPPLLPPLLLLLRLLLQLFNALLFMLSALMRIPVAPPSTAPPASFAPTVV